MKQKFLSDFNEFKERAFKAHGKHFNYVNYDWDNRKVYIEIDGIVYNQIIYEHVKGSLPKDYLVKEYFDNFIVKASKIHNNRYIYTDYIDSNKHLTVTDKVTGISYKQKVANILRGAAPKASIKKYTFEVFKKECNEIHCNKFDYKDYTSIHKPVTMIHKETGKEYRRLAYNHLRGSVPKELSKTNISQMELNIHKTIISLYPELEIVTNFRPKWLERKEIDLYLPELGIAIECNGSLYHHSSTAVPREGLLKFKKDKDYHLNKSKLCLDNSVKLIHIFDYQLKTLNLQNLIDKYIQSDITINGNSSIYVNNRTLETSNFKVNEDYLIVYFPEYSFTSKCKA